MKTMPKKLQMKKCARLKNIHIYKFILMYYIYLKEYIIKLLKNV